MQSRNFWKSLLPRGKFSRSNPVQNSFGTQLGFVAVLPIGILLSNLEMWNECTNFILILISILQTQIFSRYLRTIYVLRVFDKLINFFFFPFVTEADYTLDDSFWNEETSVGKCFNSNVDELLRLLIFKLWFFFLLNHSCWEKSIWNYWTI